MARKAYSAQERERVREAEYSGIRFSGGGKVRF